MNKYLENLNRIEFVVKSEVEGMVFDKAHVEAEILAIAKPKKAEALLKAQKDEEMRLQEQQQANALAMEQNDLLDRQNSIAEKARRDANIAAAVGAVQRHNTNKTIKKWMEK